ncbi:MAG TPA: peptidylprolyl isomerase [Gemmatimonadales bacterium]|jgi:hypothetical protein
MRRSSLLRFCGAAGLAAAGFLQIACSGGAMSPDKARRTAVAEAAGGTLSGAVVDSWLVAIKQQRPSAIVANDLVSAWVNTALVIDAIRHDGRLTDSATVDSVILPDAERGVAAQFFATRAAARAAVTDAEVDSLMDIDRVRVFQQILFRAPRNVDSASAAVLVARARLTLTRLRGGTDFTSLVKSYSDDSASRANNGFIPPLMRGQIPTQFATIWALRPNDFSLIIQSPIGLHIFHRATRAESRPMLRAWLAPIFARHADSLFVDSLARSRHTAIAPGARVRVRAIAHEPVVAEPGAPLVTWDGGGLLTPEEVRSAMLMLQPGDRVMLTDASDSAATQFLKGLARQRITIAAITSAPIPTPDARRSLAPAYRVIMDSMKAVIGRLPTGGSSADAATLFIDSVVAQHARYFPLPGALGTVLRSRSKVTVNNAALDGVIAGAAIEWQQVHKNDSIPGRGGARPAKGSGGTTPTN